MKVSSMNKDHMKGTAKSTVKVSESKVSEGKTPVDAKLTVAGRSDKTTGTTHGATVGPKDAHKS
jgi:hypothetical protein